MATCDTEDIREVEAKGNDKNQKGKSLGNGRKRSSEERRGKWAMRGNARMDPAFQKVPKRDVQLYSMAVLRVQGPS